MATASPSMFDCQAVLTGLRVVSVPFLGPFPSCIGVHSMLFDMLRQCYLLFILFDMLHQC